MVPTALNSALRWAESVIPNSSRSSPERSSITSMPSYPFSAKTCRRCRRVGGRRSSQHTSRSILVTKKDEVGGRHAQIPTFDVQTWGMDGYNTHAFLKDLCNRDDTAQPLLRSGILPLYSKPHPLGSESDMYQAHQRSSSTDQSRRREKFERQRRQRQHRTNSRHPSPS